MTHSYTLYGMTIASTLPIAGLRTASDPAVPDVTVTTGSVPDSLPDAWVGVTTCITPRAYLLHMPNIARYLIEDGQRITIAPYPDAPDSSVRLFLMGSAFGALLHQRGMLPMHASAIAVGDGAVLFSGASGAGKSTTAASLRARGYAVLADDITVVYAGKDGKPIAAPAFPLMKLWTNSLKALETDSDGLDRIRPELEKYHLPIDGAFQDTPLPVRRLYLLSQHNKPEVEIAAVTGMRKIRMLRNNVYHRRVMEIMGADAAHFSAVTALAAHTPLAVVRRPDDLTRLSDTIDAIEADMQERRA